MVTMHENDLRPRPGGESKSADLTGHASSVVAADDERSG
jgi:hypothetical protein